MDQRSNNRKHLFNLIQIIQSFTGGEDGTEHHSCNLPPIIPGQEGQKIGIVLQLENAQGERIKRYREQLFQLLNGNLVQCARRGNGGITLDPAATSIASALLFANILSAEISGANTKAFADLFHLAGIYLEGKVQQGSLQPHHLFGRHG